MTTLKLFGLSILGGFLGCWAGAEGTSKGWRRIGIPLLITTVAYFTFKNPLVLTILSLIGVLSIGYGIPSPNDPDPSALGGFWYKITKNIQLTTVLVRLTLGLGQALCLIALPIITENWSLYFMCSFFIVVANIIFGALCDKEGAIKMFGKELLIEEFLIYFFLTIFALIQMGV